MLHTDNILILAPHTDDGELGCGASIAKYILEKKKVTYAAFSTCSQSLPKEMPADTLVKECTAATKALGIGDTIFFDFTVRRLLFHRQEILEELIRINNELKPQTVFLPAKNDVHQDHQVVYAEGLRAFKMQMCWDTNYPGTILISIQTILKRSVKKTLLLKFMH